ncbi:MAG: TIGR00341 family protein [Nitrosopumilus sp.]|nr:TIGR00341 family protein [Nitrosopumilus sp.]
MKKIEVTSYADKCQFIERFLSKKDIPYQKIEGKTFEDVELHRYIITVPDDLASNIIESISKIVNTKQRDIFITTNKIDATVSEYLHDLAGKIKKPKKRPQVVEELIPQTEPFVHFKKDLFFMIMISTVIASAGLYMNSPAVVIGAMLISPLIGPLTAFSFNAAIGRPEKMLKSFVSGFILIITIVAVSSAVSLIAIQFVELPITNEIEIRTTPSPVDVVMGILLGVAAGIAMVSIIPGILVGVAIAAALVPPATVIGIGLALFDFDIFSGSLLLTSSNVVGLVLGCTIVFFLKGITPRKYHERAVAKKYLVGTIILYICLGILLTVLSVFFADVLF